LINSCDIVKEKNIEIIKSIEYKGIIVKEYRRPYNHNTLHYTIKKGNDTTTCDVDGWLEIEKYAKIGDSIIKKRGELKITLKKNDSTLKVFDNSFGY